MQRQRGILWVKGVIWTQTVHYWLNSDVSKTERRRSKRVGDAWVNIWIIPLVAGHQLGHGTLTKHPWQVVLPG